MSYVSQAVLLCALCTLWCTPAFAQKATTSPGSKADFESRVTRLKPVIDTIKPTIEQLAKDNKVDVDGYKKDLEELAKNDTKDIKTITQTLKAIEAKYANLANIFEPAAAETKTVKGLGDRKLIGWLQTQQAIAITGAVPGTVVEDPKGALTVSPMTSVRGYGPIRYDGPAPWVTIHTRQGFWPGYMEGGMVFGATAPVGNEKTKVTAQIAIRQHVLVSFTSPFMPPSVVNSHAGLRVRVTEGAHVVCESYHTVANITSILPIPFLIPSPLTPDMTLACEGARAVDVEGQLRVEVEIRASSAVYGLGDVHTHFGAEITKAQLFATRP